MLVVHHLNRSRSQRILWLLEELEVPYEIKFYKRTEQQRAPKELLEISPLGKSPVITDESVTLAESGAIIEYIIGKYGNGKAKVPEAGYIDNLYFTHYAEGSFMPVLVQKIIFGLVPDQSPFFIRPIARMIFAQLEKQLVQPEITKHLNFIESHMVKTNGSWIAGGNEPTAADYQMAFPLAQIVKVSPDVVGPKIKEYVNMIQLRPAYKLAMEKAGE